MMEILNLVIGGGTLTIAVIYIGTVIYKNVSGKKRNDNASVLLSGELMNLCEDTEKGLSRITVKSSDGNIHHGYSSVPVKQLEHLYHKGTYIQIPVIKEKD